MIARVVKSILGRCIALRHHVKHGKNPYIGLHVHIVNVGSIELGNDVIVRPLTHLYCGHRQSRLVLADGVEIGRGSTISCVHRVVVGRDVLTAPYVYIADHNHEYCDITKPVCRQGVKVKPNAEVTIGDGSWIGINAVIVGDVHIGRHCVIGANSVVVSDIPDFSVAVGSPARVIRRFSVEKGEWMKC